MFFAYVLKSCDHDYYYKGHCFDLEERIQQHNAGMTKSIRPYIPFYLTYFEDFETELESIRREKFFMSACPPSLGKREVEGRLIIDLSNPFSFGSPTHLPGWKQATQRLRSAPI